MNILPHLDILEACFASGNITEAKKYFDVIYNSNNMICVSKTYIDLIESQIEHKEAFKALIIELSDSGRICIEKDQYKTNILEEFVEIAKACKKEILVPVVKEVDLELNRKLRFVLSVSAIPPKSREWIVYELITKGSCNVSYMNFSSNKEISDFFENIYRIPLRTNSVSIFDRDRTSLNRTGLKGKPIQYFTFIPGGWKNAYILKEDLRQLRKELGPNIKMFYTSYKKNLHERKVILSGLIISSDNSMINLLVDEPTWEISIVYNDQKAQTWLGKCNEFRVLN